MPGSRTWHKAAVIGLIGNPNAGKTSLFNRLTGGNAKVGNYPGVTVEKNAGKLPLGDIECDLVDIPGLYTLTPMSMDERIATDAIRGVAPGERKADVILIAVDATNLERNLFFFSQVAELGTPIVVALTMTDIVARKGGKIRAERLAEQLGVPVVAVIAHKGTGITALKDALQTTLEKGQEPSRLTFNSVDERYAWAEEVFKAVFESHPELKMRARQDAIDQWLTHRVFGLMFFLGVMYAMFQSVYTLAQPLMAGIESVFGWIGDPVGAALAPIPWLQSLVVDGILAGIGGVAVFLPQILVLFAFIAILEGTGYLARASFLMDRLLGWCGLNGKAFIPLLSSFACAIPGVMAARIMPDHRSRLVTILIAPLMSCSARLPVYVLLIGAIIEPRYGPAAAGLTLFGMHAVGLVLAIPIIFVLNRKMLRGNRLPFLMELPPYQLPKWMDVLGAMLGRAKVFVQTAGTVIVAMTIVIWALLYFPRSDADQARFRAEFQPSAALSAEERESQAEAYVAARQLEQSYLGRFGKAIEPVFAPAGFDWRISTAILAAFPAREVLVSSLGVIFNLGNEQDEGSGDLREAVQKATWPDGRPLLTTASAFALMVFFALCCQCGSTLAVIRRETNSWKWPTFVFFYMTSLAWVMAVVVYQGLRALGL